MQKRLVNDGNTLAWFSVQQRAIWNVESSQCCMMIILTCLLVCDIKAANHTRSRHGLIRLGCLPISCHIICILPLQQATCLSTCVHRHLTGKPVGYACVMPILLHEQCLWIHAGFAKEAWLPHQIGLLHDNQQVTGSDPTQEMGPYLPTPVFAHGQLYVALSQVGSASSLIVLCANSCREGALDVLHICICRTRSGITP